MIRLCIVLFFLSACRDIASSNSSSNTEAEANNQQQQSSSCSSSGCSEPEDFELESACGFCCSSNNQISEASCVADVEEDLRQDCPEAVLLEAGCSPDLSE